MRVALMAAAICAVCMSISASAQIAGYVGGNNGKFVGSIGLIGGGSGPTGNDLLLSDGASFLLLSDGVSKLCLSSGC